MGRQCSELTYSDPLAQFLIPPQGRPGPPAAKGERHAYPWPRWLLSFRIFRPRLFSKRMALLRPRTGSLIWRSKMAELSVRDAEIDQRPHSRRVSQSRSSRASPYFNFVFACSKPIIEARRKNRRLVRTPSQGLVRRD